MRNLLFLFFLFLAGCKESGSSLAAVGGGPLCQTVDATATDIYESPTTDLLLDGTLQAIGSCVAYQGNYAWVQDAVDVQYHYAVSVVDGSMLEGSHLVFDDAGCTNVVGQEFEYPLHLGGDVYVFSFEGSFYEYPIGGVNWVLAGNYFAKVPGGSCDPYVAVNDSVRIVQPSLFVRVFSGPVSL